MQTPENPQKMGGYTIYQVAKELGVNHHTIRRWIKEGKLEAIKYTDRTIRIAPEAVKKMGAK